MEEEYIDKANFTPKDYGNVGKSEKVNYEFNRQKTKEEIKKEQTRFEKKLNAFNKLIIKIEFDVNDIVKKLGISIGGLKLDKSYSAGKSDRELITKLNFFKNTKLDSGSKSTVGVVNMNLNVRKLLKYPSLELYTLVASSVLEKALPKNSMDKVQDVTYKGGTVSNIVANSSKDVNLSINRHKASKILKIYVQSFLDKFENQNNSPAKANIITSMIMNNLDDKNVAKLLKYNFSQVQNKDGEFLLQKGNMIGLVAEEDAIFEARIVSTHERYFEGVRKGVSPNALCNLANQEMALSNVALQNKFKEAKEGIKTGDNVALKSYCEDYARKLCSSYGVDSVPIKFVNRAGSNALGEFHDKGKNGQYIEINLAKVKNIVELSTTLSHELTHAISSSINKNSGNTTKEGAGLVNDISEDISNSGLSKNSKEYKVLDEINKFCYYVNPNERESRINEITAYTFMMDFAENDSIIKKQMIENIEGRYDSNKKKNVGGYINYLKKTQDYIENINENIAKFDVQFKKLNIPVGTEAYNMIQERIAYLKLVRDNFTDFNLEKASLKLAENKVAELKGNMNKDKVIDLSNETDLNVEETKNSFEAENLRKQQEEEKKKQEEAENENGLSN